MNQMRQTIPNKNYMDIVLIRPEIPSSGMRREAGIRSAMPEDLGTSITWVQDTNGDTYWRYGSGGDNLWIIQRRMQALGLQIIHQGSSINLRSFPMTRNAYHVFI